ncbi:MAG: hypothetical protein ACK5PF_00610 [bacterium]
MNETTTPNQIEIQILGSKISEDSGFTDIGQGGSGSVHVQSRNAYTKYELVNSNYIRRIKKEAENLGGNILPVMLFVASALFSICAQDFYNKVTNGNYKFDIIFIVGIFLLFCVVIIIFKIGSDRNSSLSNILSAIEDIERERRSDDNSSV